MTISELYETFDDVSDFTKITVYDICSCGRFIDYETVFNGTFNNMPIDVRQLDIARFSHDYLNDELFVCI